jgi:membrane dipeptidase
MVNVSGEDHVGLGLDYYDGNSPFSTDDAAREIYMREVNSGRWSIAYPPPPWKFPSEIATPDMLPRLTEALSKSGATESRIEKILGGNWMRVYREIWES